MLTIKELRGLSRSLDAPKLRKQMGPFALVQKPEGALGPSGTDLMGLPSNAQSTRVAKADKMSSGALGLLMQFEELSVTTLPPMTTARMAPSPSR